MKRLLLIPALALGLVGCASTGHEHLDRVNAVLNRADTAYMFASGIHTALCALRPINEEFCARSFEALTRAKDLLDRLRLVTDVIEAAQIEQEVVALTEQVTNENATPE